jgi:hypothetical protein
MYNFLKQKFNSIDIHSLEVIKKVTIKTSDRIDHPVSLYATTEKSNELMVYI